MSEFTYWVNGSFVPASQALMPINSRGYRMADGVFDTERTFNGKIFRLEAHLERLERSLKVTRIDPGLGMAELGALSEEAAARNAHLLAEYGDFWVTQTISRGGGGNPLAAGPSHVSIIVEPLPFARYAPYYAAGMHLVTSSVRTTAQTGLDPKVKTVSRLNMVLADLEAKQTDPEGLTLLIDDEGNLAEVLYGNLFLVRSGTIRTPGGRAILEGVTRATTIELAREAGFEISQAELQPYDLYTADEAFITTTSYCVLPVSKLNGSPVGKEVPGPVTHRITQGWNELAGLDIPEQMRTFAAKAEQRAKPPRPAVR